MELRFSDLKSGLQSDIMDLYTIDYALDNPPLSIVVTTIKADIIYANNMGFSSMKYDMTELLNNVEAFIKRHKKGGNDEVQ